MTEAKTPAPDQWALLREPFPDDELELLPRYTGKKEDKGKNKKACAECGGYHDFPCIHLTYVGHAGITTRLNDVCGPNDWSWEPMGYNADGTPALDRFGGMWGWFTVMGSRKPAYGDPGVTFSGSPKASPDGMKELIGDLIRNGAMRFGIGTYLWSKSDRAKAELTRQGVEDDEPAEKPAGRTYGGGDKPQVRNPGAACSPKQLAKLVGSAKEKGYTEADLIITARKRYGVIDSLGELSKGDASKFIDAIAALEPKGGGGKDLPVEGEVPIEALDTGTLPPDDAEEIPF